MPVFSLNQEAEIQNTEIISIRVLEELFPGVKGLVINHIAIAHISLPIYYSDFIFRGIVSTFILSFKNLFKIFFFF